MANSPSMGCARHTAVRTVPAVVLAMLLAVLAAPALAQPPDFVGLVERVSPAVVNVEATRTAEARLRGGPSTDDEQMEEFLRRFFGQPGAPGARPQPMPDRTSMGSGFLIGDGYVLTNHHVVDSADEVVVRLLDRREYDAEVIGSDAQSDVALLKIDASGLPSVRIGDSDALRPGQWVLAIGSPFGFEHSVTSGIVSAVGRSSYDQNQQYVPFIQTDVAINRGNSGGPLFNIEGEVVGINSQIFSNTGGFLGISFAIPIEVAINVVDQIKATGTVTRGLLGVTIQDVRRDEARALGLQRPRGALVNSVGPGSAAEKAGVRLGDVVLAFNGRQINRSAELPPLVGLTRPGSQATLQVFRNGKTLDLPVVVGALDPSAAVAPGEAPEAAAANALGLQVEDLAPEQRTQLGLDEDEGVLVTRVAGAAARRANVQQGDVVLMVGRTRVGSVQEFERAVSDVEPGEAVMLLLRRGDSSFFSAISAPVPGNAPDAD